MRLFPPRLLPLLSQTSHIFYFLSFTCLEIHDERVSDGATEESQNAVHEQRRSEAAERGARGL